MSKLPVVAAVPNYNMAEQLQSLLPNLMAQGYTDIFVLDDASSDHSREVTETLSTDIHFIGGDKQLEAGGNRNRIIPALGYKAIVHFIDADMELEAKRCAERIQEATPAQAVGFVAGLVREKSGRQMAYNYGPRQTLRNDIAGLFHLYLHSVGDKQPDREKVLRARYEGFLKDWPDTSVTPFRRNIYWGAEGNLMVDSEVFSKVGGFDPKLQDHEIQDLAIRLDGYGLRRIFDPLVAATHHAVQVRAGNRGHELLKAEAAIARKHGVMKWLTSK